MGEFIEGVRCISVPVKVLDGQVVAPLSIAAETMSLNDIGRWIPCLGASAEALAEKLSRIPGSLRVLRYRPGGVTLGPVAADPAGPEECPTWQVAETRASPDLPRWRRAAPRLGAIGVR